MNFRGVFVAITIATAMIVAAYLVNSRRPRVVVEQPSAAFVRASGKCAECHLNSQFSVVQTYVGGRLVYARRSNGLPPSTV